MSSNLGPLHQAKLVEAISERDVALERLRKAIIERNEALERLRKAESDLDRARSSFGRPTPMAENRLHHDVPRGGDQ